MLPWKQEWFQDCQGNTSPLLPVQFWFKKKQNETQKSHERERQNLPGTRHSNLITVKTACGKEAAKGACWRETRELAKDQWADASFQQSWQGSWAVSLFLLLPRHFSVPTTKRDAVPKETSNKVCQQAECQHLQRTKRFFLIFIVP